MAAIDDRPKPSDRVPRLVGRRGDDEKRRPLKADPQESAAFSTYFDAEPAGMVAAMKKARVLLVHFNPTAPGEPNHA